MRGRWEGLPVGNFFENLDFFAGFPRRTGFQIMDFSVVSRDF
jgi:hypothetical protein